MNRSFVAAVAVLCLAGAPALAGTETATTPAAGTSASTSSTTAPVKHKVVKHKKHVKSEASSSSAAPKQ